MLQIKSKFILFTPFFILLIWFIFPFVKIFRLTLSYEPNKIYELNNLNYSYEIYSTNNKLISKLSSKFDVLNTNEKIPSLMQEAFISSEDKNFLKHHGIDLFGTSRAFIKNLQSGYIKEGGSTISQQASRIIFLNNELTFKRKIKEIIISLIMELKFDKNQIFKIYINNIYLGEGAYGINEAAAIYFGKLISELTLSEIALLAGLAPAPSIYSPFRNYDLAIINRNQVLNSMHKDGYISKKELKAAMDEKIILTNQKKHEKYKNNKTLIKFILQEAKDILKIKKITLNENEHLIINSSINEIWQAEAQNLFQYLFPKDIEMALISIESDSGLIKAMIGGREYQKNQFNRAISAVRPLGSTFKIIPYIAALSNGIKLEDTYLDLPTCWDNYCPKNFSKNYRGRISLKNSFKQSSNIIPIRISEEIGLKKIINLANLFGLGHQQKIGEFLPLAIGAYGDSLINITNAYSSLNNKGILVKPRIINNIELKNKELIWQNAPKGKRIINLEVTRDINILLRESVRDGNAIAASIENVNVYGKTGTSDKNKDVWFIGSIGNLTTGIWLGFDNNKESNLSSGNAAQLWKSFIQKINP